MENGLFKTRRVAGLFAAIAFIGGFFFLNQGMTGNVIGNPSPFIFNYIFLIGTLLVFCAVVLVIYIIKRK